MTDTVFREIYKKLNSAQKEAVDTIEGPVMVIAGPGTGKTEILTLRIANILEKTDTRPENILALTFTESGARAMQERLRSYIGSAAYQVEIATFHGFAEKLIKLYPDAYPHIIGSHAASDIEKVDFIQAILEDKGIRQLRPMGNPEYYVSHILSAISTMKREYVSPDAFSLYIAKGEKELASMEKIHEKGAHKGKVRGEYQKKEKSIEKSRELLFVFRQYEALFREQNFYDFDDMIVETVAALAANEDMLRDLQETYHYILADEHQDVNGSQNKILELLSSYHDSPNIFVVGDEKQAIYRFQGASLENFLYFEDVYKNTKTIALTTNYRSGQSILNASHKLIQTDDEKVAKLRVPLTSYDKKTAVVENRTFTHEAVENIWLIEAVKRCIEGGVSPEEIAIIVRTNREVEAIAGGLRKKEISAEASADGDVLSHPITNAVRALIDALSSKKSEEALFRVLHGSYWGIEKHDLVSLMSARNYEKTLSKITGSEEYLKDAGVEDVESVLRVTRVLETARKRETTEPPHRALEYLLNESGFLGAVMEEDPLEGARVVRRLYDEIEEMVLRDNLASLSEVGRAFDQLVSHNLSLNAPYIHVGESAVRVMTAHKSKGLEFDYVFIPHLTDKAWGGRRTTRYFDIPMTKHLNADSLDPLDDERRLLYVAMTRARKELRLSSSETGTDGREFAPSRFLEDIGDEDVASVDTEKEEKAFDPLAMLVGAPKTKLPKSDLLRSVLLERGISATALNNYLRSPWDYFYRNALRIPEVQTLPALYGTAIHGVLESMAVRYKEDKKLPNETEIKRFLERELGRLPINENEYTKLHERGLSALTLYREHLAASLGVGTKEEFRLRVVLPTGNKELPEIPLTGMLDRIDLDEEGKAIRIVDYKTGKPRTRNNIEGKTKNSDGDYKRQLVFYALLLSLYDDERYRCKEGVLSFVEPDPKGKIHEEAFTVTDAEIEELKKEIIRVALEIANGALFSAPCDKDTTSYSDLAEAFLKKDDTTRS